MVDIEDSAPVRKLPPISPRTVSTQSRTTKKSRRAGSRSDGEVSSSGADAPSRIVVTRRAMVLPPLSASRETDATTPGPAKKKKKIRRFPKEETAIEMDETKGRPQRKRKLKTENPVGSQTSLLSDKEQEKGPSMKPKKMKIKRKMLKSECGFEENFLDGALAEDLNSIKEDIVDAQKTETGNVFLPVTASATILQSQPTDKLYIETLKKFKTESKHKTPSEDDLEKVQQYNQDESVSSSIELAIKSHRLFKVFTLFCHGLTAGIALWQIVIVEVLRVYENLDFMMHYKHLAMPVQSLFYALLAICTLSACDRFDIGHPTRRFLLQAISLQSGAVSVLVYFIAIILSTSIAAFEDKIYLFGKDPGKYVFHEEQMFNEMEVWRNVNIARCVCAILGWMIISLGPNKDRLENSLETAMTTLENWS